MDNITLQIPMKDYGTLATLAAAASMPLDKYVVQITMEATQNANKK